MLGPLLSSGDAKNIVNTPVVECIEPPEISP